MEQFGADLCTAHRRLAAGGDLYRAQLVRWLGLFLDAQDLWLAVHECDGAFCAPSCMHACGAAQCLAALEAFRHILASQLDAPLPCHAACTGAVSLPWLLGAHPSGSGGGEEGACRGCLTPQLYRLVARVAADAPENGGAR